MAFVNWSSPVRLAGSTPLLPIPNEIYVEIFDYFTPSYTFTKAECKRTLSNLAPVCRLFCAMALPRIFKSIEFSGGMCKNESAVTPSYASFCRAIIKGQEPAASLSCHVKECTFVEWSVDDTERFNWVQSGFLKLYGQALGRMPNLQSIVLDSMAIDKHLLKTLCGLEGLQSLLVKDCRGLDITDAVLQKITPLKLRSFSCYGSGETTKILARIVSPSNLEHLIVRVHRWSGARRILEIFAEESSLVLLDIAYVTYDPILSKVLELSKGLKTLRIFGRQGAYFPSQPFSPSSLPKLGVLKAPIQLALALVPGRPLHSVIISVDNHPNSVSCQKVDFLSKSTIPIRSLQIPVQCYLHTAFDEFAQLETLHLCHELDNHGHESPPLLTWFEDEAQVIAQKWRSGSAPPIRELHLDFVDYDLRNYLVLDLQLQHRMIVGHLAAAFASVDVFSLATVVQWRKDRHTGRWIPFVPVECYEKLASDLSRLDADRIQDFDGCLSTVSSSIEHTPELEY